jgi:hypothetical protein
MMAAAARRHINLIGVNLWQTGLRSLFRYFMYRSELTQDEAWAVLREELSKRVPADSEEWEYQQIRAVLYEELNLTLEDAKEMYNRYPDSTPMLDAIRACLQNLDKLYVDGSE